MLEPLHQPGLPDAFDLRRAVRLARLSAAAYRSTPADIAAEIELATVAVFSEGAAFGFRAQVAGDVVLTFRGTTPAVEERERGFVQWLANLNYGQVEAWGGRVHRGFVEALDPVWESVRWHAQEAARNGARLWLTGHSLGGALATLAGARLSAEALPPAAVYTFGAPRIGDEAFAANYQPILHRIENANDIVCHIPPPPALTRAVKPLLERLAAERLNWHLPTDISYEDAGRLTFIDWDGTVHPEVPAGERLAISSARLFRFVRMAFMASERASLLVDHRIINYVELLAKAAAS